MRIAANRFARMAVVVGACIAAISCSMKGGRAAGEQVASASGLYFRVRADSLPPHAAEHIMYSVLVTDSTTGQPLEGGQGRIFATNRDGFTVFDNLIPGAQPGTYRAKLMFVTSGLWAMALEFRRDSLKPLDRPIDWQQEVRAPKPIGG